ncbi:unnamed protein product, partial [Rotaria sp. Silwood2]
DSIGKVQQNTEFYWHYQRYTFVREYFERVPLFFPPLIIISHIILITLALRNKCCPKLCRNQVANVNNIPFSKRLTRIFKMIPINNSQNDKWDSFENAATFSYIRSILEKEKNKDALTSAHEKQKKTVITIGSDASKTTASEQQTPENLKKELVSVFKSVLTETRKGSEQNNSTIESRLDRMEGSLEWMMKAMERVKMNNPDQSRPTFDLPPVRNVT